MSDGITELTGFFGWGQKALPNFQIFLGRFHSEDLEVSEEKAGKIR
jgi:hypothetical protein